MGAGGCTLSERIWQADWTEGVPKAFGGVTLERGTFEQAAPFVREHYQAIFGADGQADRFLVEPMSPAKMRFGAEMDVLHYRHDNRTVGLLMGHPIDWSTYYFRSVALLPQYRERHVVTDSVAWTHDRLAAVGVHRVEGECAPANAPMMKMLVNLGYIVTSTTNSERWGATVRFTKFLRAEAKETFMRQFCAMRTPPRSSERDG